MAQEALESGVLLVFVFAMLAIARVTESAEEILKEMVLRLQSQAIAGYARARAAAFRRSMAESNN